MIYGSIIGPIHFSQNRKPKIPPRKPLQIKVKRYFFGITFKITISEITKPIIAKEIEMNPAWICMNLQYVFHHHQNNFYGQKISCWKLTSPN